MKNPLHIIKKPLVTEKATNEAAEHNRHAFLVDRRATKPQIKQAVEELYGVRVVGVSTMVRKGKLRRYRYGYVQETPTKKAVVKVHPEDTIELF